MALHNEDPSAFVDELLEGYVLSHAGLCFERAEDARVVLRRQPSPTGIVALVSGGGSGHEPAHAGFVGDGCLSAAVCGNTFASPSASAVLRAILSVCSPAGVLLVVKNYTGDRLNFGVARERALALGCAVETVLVGDDVALSVNPVVGRRGLAGALFVHKVAGAAAAAGLPLALVAEEALAISRALATVNCALSLASLPGSTCSHRTPPGTLDFGGGIHGETGAQQLPLQPADAVVAQMLARLLNNDFVSFPPGCGVALLVSSLGGTPLGEVAIVCRAAVAGLRAAGRRVRRVYSGALMTSLDARGVSLTLLRIDSDALLARLDAPTDAPAWPRFCGMPDELSAAPTLLAAAPATDSVLLPPGAIVREHPLGNAIRAAASRLVALEAQLDAWDAVAGDGDCGATLAKGAAAVLADLGRYRLECPADTLAGLAASVRRSVGGTSGVLFDILFSAAEAHVRATGNCDWLATAESGVAAVMRYGGAQPGMRTMLDAWVPALEAARGAGGWKALEAAAAAAEQGAEATKEMQARAGRSSYIAPAALRDTPDPGAMAVAALLRAAADSRLEREWMN